MGAGRSGLNESTGGVGQGKEAPQADSAASAGRVIGPARRSTTPPGHLDWKGILTFLLLLQPLVASVLTGAYMTRHTWGEWIRRLAMGGFGSKGGVASLGAIAPREPTVVYYRPGQLSLGDFSISMYDPVTRITLRADFRLEAQAQCENRQAFEAFVLMYHRLVRDQVMTAVRNAPIEELADPEHRLLKRRILSQVNRTLGQPFLKAVELKNFSLWESVDQMSFLPYQSPQNSPPLWQ